MIDERKKRQLRHIQRTYYLVTALSWFAAVLPAAVSILFAQSRGFSIFQIGLYGAVYALTVALLELPTGGLADTLGRKRTALLAYTFALAASTVLLFAFSLPALLGYALLYGTSRALASGALQAWFVDAMRELSPDIDLQPPLAVAGTFELLALAAATLLGSLLPTAFHGLPADGTAVLTPLATPVAASMLMTAVVMLTVALGVRDVRTAAASPDARSHERLVSGQRILAAMRDGLGLVHHNRVLRLLLWVEVLSGFALTGVETFWQPFFAERLVQGGERTWIFGLLLGGSFLAGMLGTLIAIPVGRGMEKRYARVAALFHALRILALLVLAAQQGAVLAAGFFWLTYFAMGASNPALATLFHLEAAADRRSVLLSLQSMAGFSGGFVGSLLLGWIAQHSSIGMAWGIAAMLAGAGVFLLLRIDRTQAVARAQAIGATR